MEDIPENQNSLNEPKTAVSVTIEGDSEAEVTPAKKKNKRERPPPDPTDPAVIAAKAAEHTKGKFFCEKHLPKKEKKQETRLLKSSF